ncbi:MAG: hypothetical protein AVDCRST_MAG59-3365 [uncultured Thermomicrobiales bacterium]|uniref:RNA polymerase ECF-type sigma factor n=1 Tax=uncultured Thermomicrobiales bacterium TaxID=1645740 RepID=A0A6J4V4T7_9BACT|nr:MAG: hypothetical protein AVDCRST_MAG59-3365 [uncultured Thermomicrobiales bacterium]
MAERGDDDLIAAIARRDPNALLALYGRHGRLAFALAYRVLGDAQTAEEAVQDAFLQVWQRAASCDVGRGSGRGWLLTIVHRRAIDARRRSRHRLEMGLDAVEATLAAPDAWDEVVHGLERDEVRAALRMLPEGQRQAIDLAYYEGLTHREIAERTGTPLGTVKGRLRLGLEKLHATLVAARAQGGGQAEEGGGGGVAAPLAADRRGGGGATRGR